MLLNWAAPCWLQRHRRCKRVCPALHDIKVEQQLDALLGLAHDWPGNVRELDNWVERLLAGSDYLDSGRVAFWIWRAWFRIFLVRRRIWLWLLEPAAARQAQLRDARSPCQTEAIARKC